MMEWFSVDERLKKWERKMYFHITKTQNHLFVGGIGVMSSAVEILTRGKRVNKPGIVRLVYKAHQV